MAERTCPSGHNLPEGVNTCAVCNSTAGSTHTDAPDGSQAPRIGGRRLLLLLIVVAVIAGLAGYAAGSQTGDESSAAVPPTSSPHRSPSTATVVPTSTSAALGSTPLDLPDQGDDSTAANDGIVVPTDNALAAASRDALDEAGVPCAGDPEPYEPDGDLGGSDHNPSVQVVCAPQNGTTVVIVLWPSITTRSELAPLIADRLAAGCAEGHPTPAAVVSAGEAIIATTDTGETNSEMLNHIVELMDPDSGGVLVTATCG